MLSLCGMAETIPGQMHCHDASNKHLDAGALVILKTTFCIANPRNAILYVSIYVSISYYTERDTALELMNISLS